MAKNEKTRSSGKLYSELKAKERALVYKQQNDRDFPYNVETGQMTPSIFININKDTESNE